MTKTHYMLKSFLQKRSYFIRNLNVLKRGGKDEAKKIQGLGGLLMLQNILKRKRLGDY